MISTRARARDRIKCNGEYSACAASAVPRVPSAHPAGILFLPELQEGVEGKAAFHNRGNTNMDLYFEHRNAMDRILGSALLAGR